MTAVLGAIVLAAADGEEASGLDLVLPAQAELIWGIVGFALLFAVIYFKAWPSLNAMLESRRTEIQGKLEDAETARQEAEQIRRQYNEQLAEARNEAQRIIDDAKQQAERLRGDIVAKAEEEAEQIRQRARVEQEAERARLLQELRGQVAAISIDIASKIVDAEVDQARHDQLVDSYIRQLSSSN